MNTYRVTYSNGRSLTDKFTTEFVEAENEMMALAELELVGTRAIINKVN